MVCESTAQDNQGVGFMENLYLGLFYLNRDIRSGILGEVRYE